MAWHYRMIGHRFGVLGRRVRLSVLWYIVSIRCQRVSWVGLASSEVGLDVLPSPDAYPRG